jgi:hypothetical protein
MITSCLDCGAIIRGEHPCRVPKGGAVLRVVVHSNAGIGVIQKLSGTILRYKPACTGKPCTCWGIMQPGPNRPA